MPTNQKREYNFRIDSPTPTSPAKQEPDVKVISIDHSAFNLEKIEEIAQVSEGKALQLMEACVWCLFHCKHENGVSMKVVDGDKEVHYSVIWNVSCIDIEAVRRSYNQDDAIEAGAEAIAFCTVIKRTNYSAVERASTTTGIDYWLGYKDRHPNEPFHRSGRLEISGIMIESESNKVSTRLKVKQKQTKPTDHTFPVYIIVVEFSKPYTTMVLKNANSQ